VVVGFRKVRHIEGAGGEVVCVGGTVQKEFSLGAGYKAEGVETDGK
jgi:hypothetical protein